MKTKLNFTLFLLFVGLNLIAQCPTPPTTAAEFVACNATIATAYAPNIYQNTNTDYDDAVSGKADIFTRVDYDGDWNHLNNWNNLPPTAITPNMYYTVHWTDNYWVIVYMLYYARDYAREGFPFTGLCEADEHEGDGARIMLIVDRSSGIVQGSTITTHDNHDSQVPVGSSLTLVSPNPTPLEININTTSLYSAAGSHSLYFHLIGFEYQDSPNPCRPSVTATILYPTGSYGLTDVLAPNGLWDNRYSPSLFHSNWQFMGDDRAEDKTPWAPWQGERIDDMFNFLGDRFNEFNESECLFCPYDCDFDIDVTTSKNCNAVETTELVSVTSNLADTPENLISTQWFYDPIAFTCMGCDEPANLSPTFINHNLQNGTTPSNGKAIKVNFETVDCGTQFLTKYIPSRNPDEIYISGYSTFNSGSPFNNQIRTFTLVGDDVSNASNITWTLGPNLTCVSGCYNSNPISIKPSPGAPDGATYIEATFNNSGQNGCVYKIRQKITIDLDKPSLDFDFTAPDLEECVHNGDVLTIPFSYHGTWDFGFPIINIEASLVEISTGNTIALTSTVAADHNPNQNGSPIDNFYFGDGTVSLQLPEDLPLGNYQLSMNVTYTNFQDGSGHYATTALDGDVYCHDYGLGQGSSTTFDCILPLGNLCIIPCNIDVAIEFDMEQGAFGLITEMTATAVSDNPESYQYLWSDESTSNSVTIDCGNETFSLTITNPLTGCVRVFPEIYLYTSVACQHEGPVVIRSSEGDDGDNDLEFADHAEIQSIFPNPSSGVYTILLDNTVVDCTISVFNLASGKLVMSKKHTNTNKMELDITNHPSDIYIVQILVGGQNFYRRIIKI